jgi:hypothetical protein
MISANLCRKMTCVYSVGCMRECPLGSKSPESTSSSSRFAGSFVSVWASEIEVGLPTSSAVVLTKDGRKTRS